MISNQYRPRSPVSNRIKKYLLTPLLKVHDFLPYLKLKGFFYEETVKFMH